MPLRGYCQNSLPLGIRDKTLYVFLRTEKTVESVKVFILGVLVYISPSLFLSLGKRWFNELKTASNPPWETRARTLRTRFWRAVVLVLCVVGCTLLVLYWSGYSRHNGQYWLRVAAVVFLLTATLGRGGWAIESWTHNTIIERIDRGMYLIGQLGGTVLLLFALSF